MAYNDYGNQENTYSGHISIIDGLVPSGDTNFPLMSANSIWVPERWDRYINDTQANPYTTGIRLDKRIQQLEDDKVNREGGDKLVGNYHFTDGILVGDRNITPTKGVIYCDLLSALSLDINGLFEVGAQYVESLLPMRLYKDVTIGGAPKGTNALLRLYGKMLISSTDYDACFIAADPAEFHSTIKTSGNATFEKDVLIEGDLTVKGLTTSEQHTTVTVEDNLLVLNTYKTEEGFKPASTQETGIVFCLGDKTYGLLLDSEGTVSLGEGILNSDADNNKSFVWTENTKYPLALRDLSDSDDGYLLSWNKEHNHIVSSQKTVKDI
jgi:hypothetical protein